jgi:hypothetical protein
LKNSILNNINNSFSSINIFQFYIDDGKIIFIEDNTAQFFNYKTAKEFLDQHFSFFQFFPQENLMEITKLLKEKGEISSYTLDFNINSKKKRVSLFLKLNDNKTVDGLFSDISNKAKELIEIQEAKLKAEIANKEKTAFLTHMSHELRTPLNAVFGMTELLLKTDLTNKQFEYVNIITKSAENLLVITNDMLDISKIESEKLVIEQVNFKLKDVLTSAFNTVFYTAKQKGLELFCDYLQFEDDIILKGDPIRLNQIFFNILDNAIRYTEKGSVYLKLDILNENSEKADIKFEIVDTGIGISEEKLDGIFKNFTGTQSVKKKEYSGLGLFIANQLASLMNGRINAESEIGKGSKFSIYMSFNKGSDDQLDNQKNEIISEPIANDINILLAEDQAFNQIVVVNILDDLGYSIDVVENGLQAIDKLKGKSYDVILMDIQMPEMDGIEATKIIRSSFPEPVSKIPIIAITANAYSEDHKNYIEIGMNETISKPFRSYELFQKISSVLKIKQVASKQDTIDINTFYNFTLKENKENQKLYDLSLIKNISKGKPDMMVKMLETFLSRTDEEIKLLKLYCNEHNWENARKMVHKMKPSISYLGMKEIESKISNVQRIVKEERNYENLDRELEYIEKLLNRSFTMIKEEVDILKTSE